MWGGIGASGASGSGGGGGGGGGVVDDGTSALRRLKLKKAGEVEWPTGRSKFLPRVNNDVPPLIDVDVYGTIDTSNALPVHVDGNAVKQCSQGLYVNLLEFATQCYRKCDHRLFTHPGHEQGVPGGLVSLGCQQLEMHPDKEFYLQRAIMAITQYNLLSQANLRLENLLKVNSAWWSGDVYFMTFSAYDENTGKTGTYQAALRSVRNARVQDLPNSNIINGYVLGLFKDCSTDMILACISIKGAEEDLAANINRYESARAGVAVPR